MKLSKLFLAGLLAGILMVALSATIAFAAPATPPATAPVMNNWTVGTLPNAIYRSAVFSYTTDIKVNATLASGKVVSVTQTLTETTTFEVQIADGKLTLTEGKLPKDAQIVEAEVTTILSQGFDAASGKAKGTTTLMWTSATWRWDTDTVLATLRTALKSGTMPGAPAEPAAKISGAAPGGGGGDESFVARPRHAAPWLPVLLRR